MFAYAFPPYKAIGAIRLHGIARAIRESGSTIFVYSTSNIFISPKEAFSLEGLNVARLPTLDYKTIQNALALIVGRTKVKSDITKGVRRSRVLPYLVSFPINLFVGMGGIVYILFSILFSLTRIKKGDILFSSYSPFADHFICFILKKIRPSLFWICDFRDLHITPGDEEMIKFIELNKIIDYKILSAANIITSVSEGLHSELYRTFKTSVILKNAIHPKIVGLFSKFQNLVEQDKFRITYTGGLYNGRRNPEVILKAASLLLEDGRLQKNDFEIVYAGPDAPLWDGILSKYNLEEYGTTYNSLSLEESIKVQCESCINLLLTWSTSEQKGILTGKYYEYLMARRPIINIINGVKDTEIEKLFNETRAGHVYYNDSDCGHVSNCLLDYYLDWKSNGQLDSNVSDETVQSNLWEARIQEFWNDVNENGLI